MVINQINEHKAKICDHYTYTQIIIKHLYFFSSQSVRMSGNSINFDDNKIKISDFYKNKNKKMFNTDVNKILVSKNEQIIILNTLLDIMIMILLDHYL